MAYPAKVPCPQTDCDGSVTWDSHLCSICLSTIEPPNVRWALHEKSHLDLRYDAAMVRLKARGADHIAIAYEADVAANSKGIFAVPLQYALQMLDERSLHQNYHTSVNGSSRVAAQPQQDSQRLAVDATLFGRVGSKITMAALSLGGTGLASYGDVFMEFRQRFCEKRASLLEENSFTFVDKHPGGMNKLPLGHRAVWSDRGKLAVLAAESHLDATTDPSHFANLLLGPGATRHDDRFLEVHLYESWNLDSVASMKVFTPSLTSPFKKAQSSELEERARARGISWGEIS